MGDNFVRNKSVLELWIAGDSEGSIIKKLPSFTLTRSIVAGIVKRARAKRGPGTRHTAPYHSLRKPLPAPKPILVLVPTASVQPELIGPIGDIPDAGFCKYFPGEITSQMQACGHPTKSIEYPYCEFHTAELKKGSPKAYDYSGKKQQR